MKECENCGAVFEKLLIVYEKHGLDTPPYERIEVCPVCRIAGYWKEKKYESKGN